MIATTVGLLDFSLLSGRANAIARDRKLIEWETIGGGEW